ncbi:MAG TPA: hypothetical protein VM142_07670 [Acidimicrobiales bacterium]|nr:hypothetical protein [Acidimicrobiales bacterium]
MTDNAITRALRLLDDHQLASVGQMYGRGATSDNAGDHCRRLAEFHLAIAVTAAIEQQRRLELMRCTEEALGTRWNAG